MENIKKYTNKDKQQIKNKIWRKYIWCCHRPEDEDSKPMSKKGLKKQQKEAEKAAKKLQQQQEQSSGTAAESAGGGDVADCATGCYGVMEMIQSKEKVDRTIVRVGDLTADRAGEKVWIRGRLHTSRAVGEHVFWYGWWWCRCINVLIMIDYGYNYMINRQHVIFIRCSDAVGLATGRAFSL